jgi:hypothetical protein
MVPVAPAEDDAEVPTTTPDAAIISTDPWFIVEPPTPDEMDIEPGTAPEPPVKETEPAR